MEYWKMVNGALHQVHDFDDTLESIRIEYQSKVDAVNRLSEENERLRDEAYKDNELAAMKKELSDTKKRFQEQMEDYNRGFPISIGEYINIEAWKRQHLAKVHGAKTAAERMEFGGAIGGTFKYEFTQTSLGVIGSVKCSCGEEYIFQDLY